MNISSADRSNLLVGASSGKGPERDRVNEVRAGGDLVGIGRRAINYLTSIAPREENFTPFFGGKVPWKGTPYLVHCPWDYGDGIGRLLEALAFVRRMTRDDRASDVQEGMLARLCSLYSPDGITYREANLWSSRVSGPWEMRSSLMALVAMLENGRGDLSGLISSAVDGIARVFSGDTLTQASGVWDGQRWTGERYIGVEIGPGLPLVDALVRTFNATGNEKALELAGTLVAHYYRGPKALFRPDGSCCFPGDEGQAQVPTREQADYTPSLGHFHTRTAAAVGLARYGIAAGERFCLDLARRIHDHLAQFGSRFGWYPENMFTAGREVSELCGTLDMIELELLLAGAGQTGLYSHVERAVRNHVAVSQFSPDALVQSNIATDPPAERDVTGQVSYSQVLPKLAGGFVCVSYPDELYTAYPGSRHDPDPSYKIDISGCCSGSGAKSAYVVWRDTVIEDDACVRVNFPFSRQHPAVDVMSEDKGSTMRVTLECRTPKPVLFRLPDGVLLEQIHVTPGSNPTQGRPAEGYVLARPAGTAGGSVTLEFPLKEREETCEVSGLVYRVRWIGSRVVETVCQDGQTPRRNPYTEWFRHEQES